MSRISRVLLGAALFSMIAIGAQARGGGEGNNTGCNGQGNPNSPCVPGSGGQGGAGGAGGNATAIAGSSSTAVAGAAAVNNTRVNARGGNARSNATGGNAASTQNTNVNVTDGGYNYRERLQAPAVTAPSMWSNNPCIITASGSVSVVGFGASLGAGIEDVDCTRRANAQLLQAMGEPNAAREVMCNNREVREAFARSGRACAADQPAMRSVSIQPTAPVVTEVAARTPAPVRQVPSYCRPGVMNSECQP